MNLLWVFSSLLAICSASQIPFRSLPHRNNFLVKGSDLPLNASSFPDSYSGYIPIRKTADYDAQMFYWFFPKEIDGKPAPIVIWLQGGPGSSSAVGLFTEMGPFTVNDDGETLSLNPDTWNEKYSMLYIDNPVGTGYSYVEQRKLRARAKDMRRTSLIRRFIKNHQLDSETIGISGHVASPYEDADYNVEGYCKTEKAVGQDFLIFIREFYLRYHEQEHIDLWIATESYGGKYGPGIASLIHMFNTRAPPHIHIPFRGLLIGNQWTDPVTEMAVHGTQAAMLGLVSNAQAKILDAQFAKAAILTRSDRWLDALQARLDGWDMIANWTNGVNWFDVRRGNADYSRKALNKFLRSEKTRNLLHVGNHEYHTENGVMDGLLEDIMHSTSDLFPVLIDNYRILVYQGNFDYRDGVASVSSWLENGLAWSGTQEFLESERRIWTLKKSTHTGTLGGFVNRHKNLTRVVVWGAGHLVPGDVGPAAKELVESFIEDTGVFAL